ncbi:hypothetical protein SASPL_139552 [Salvia splendens]|uniref:Uncharacterized protein n=1 Tax=Salvia splendens TaxID=180675 RepID=A0A8X8WQH4_SALSN|nr:hypothetical protein SASPL_139552 [Salvia splendens]
MDFGLLLLLELRRGRDRPRRLHVRLRRVAAPRVDVVADPCHAAGVHGGARVRAGEAALHGLLCERGGAGAPHGRRPAGSGASAGVFSDADCGGAVRTDSAAG